MKLDKVDIVNPVYAVSIDERQSIGAKKGTSVELVTALGTTFVKVSFTMSGKKSFLIPMTNVSAIYPSTDVEVKEVKK